MKKSIYALSVLILACSFQAGISQAASVNSAHTEVELIAEANSIQPDSDMWVALRMKMDPHWHTYWKNPGDSGLPAVLDWQLPGDMQAGEILWPYPGKLELAGLMTYGYEGEILLLTKIEVPKELPPGKFQTLKLNAKWLACEEICIPGEADLSITLPVLDTKPLPNPKWTQAFSIARANLPLEASDWEIKAEAYKNGFVLLLQTPNNLQANPKEIYFYPEASDLINHIQTQNLKRTRDGFRLEIEKSELSDKNPDALTGILYSSEGWRGPQSEKALAIAIPVKTVKESSLSFASQNDLVTWSALLFAFIGGLLLNLMPCVLPVLSIKILNFVSIAREKKSFVFKQGLLFTSGVLISFWVLALALIALKSAGQALGWGFQLQSPLFVALLGALFIFLTLNLWGLFEINLPLASAASRTSSDSFLSGILATIVATPCTAPFMGSALGFAMTQSTPLALAIFTSLALGMSLPYLVLSGFPQLLKFIPKPGTWMIRLKQFLGSLLLLTAIWLSWVLSLQLPVSAFVPVIVCFVTIGLACFFFGLADKKQSSSFRLFALVLFIIAFSGIVYSSLSRGSSNGSSTTEQHASLWENYSAATLEQSLDSGEAVFIDFTAAWCLTCQVNKRLTLNQPEVVEAFKANQVRLLKADWTNHDEEITQALAGYGRNSIPLYVYYAAGSNKPQLLPEVITPKIVIDVLGSES